MVQEPMCEGRSKYFCDYVEDAEKLAKEIHEAGRRPVEVVTVLNPIGCRFIEWNDLSDAARDGYRIQARHLINRFNIEYVPKNNESR